MKLTAPLIYGLIASILLVSAPHAEHLPIWVSAMCVALLGWRGYLAYSGTPLPSRWLLLLITTAAPGAEHSIRSYARLRNCKLVASTKGYHRE
jgi:hypothetical protein